MTDGNTPPFKGWALTQSGQTVRYKAGLSSKGENFDCGTYIDGRVIWRPHFLDRYPRLKLVECGGKWGSRGPSIAELRDACDVVQYGTCNWERPKGTRFWVEVDPSAAREKLVEVKAAMAKVQRAT